MSYQAPEGSVSVNVTGSEEVRARFADATSRTRRAADALVQHLAEQLRDEAIALAPRKHGGLQRSIKALETMGRTGLKPADTIRWVVRPRMGRRKDYAYNVEFGQLPIHRTVKQYTRRLRSRDVRAWSQDRHGKSRRKMIAQGVQYVSGYTAEQTMKAQPYLGRAFERMRKDLHEAMTTGLQTIVARTLGGMDAPGTGDPRGGK